MIGLMPIATALTMISPDADVNDGTDVADVLHLKRQTPGYPALLEEIRRDGITIPVVVRKDAAYLWLEDGHHRIAAAVDLGLEVVPWTNVPLREDA